MDGLWPAWNSRDHRNGEDRADRDRATARFFSKPVFGCLGLVFVLRAIGNLRTFGFFKTVTGTPFADWDTWLYSPLCLLLALLAAGLATLPQQR